MLTLRSDTCYRVVIRQLNVNSMKMFPSYGHDSNAQFIETIKDYLSKDAEENLKQFDLRPELPSDMKGNYHFGEI